MIVGTWNLNEHHYYNKSFSHLIGDYLKMFWNFIYVCCQLIEESFVLGLLGEEQGLDFIDWFSQTRNRFLLIICLIVVLNLLYLKLELMNLLLKVAFELFYGLIVHFIGGCLFSFLFIYQFNLFIDLFHFVISCFVLSRKMQLNVFYWLL